MPLEIVLQQGKMEYFITIIIVLIALFFIYKKIRSKEKCAKCGNIGCIAKSCDIEFPTEEGKGKDLSKTV
jgi:hypothetical protein